MGGRMAGRGSKGGGVRVQTEGGGVAYATNGES